MSTTSEIIGLLTGFSVIFILTLCLFIFAGLILTVVGKWKVFKKAGKNGWEALIPYYNTWVLCEIADIKWWFFLIIIAGSLLGGSSIGGLLGLAALVATYFVNYNIARKFDKEPVGFAFGLTLLPFIFYPILGMGDATYKNVKVSEYGPVSEKQVEKAKEDIKTKTSTNNNNENNKFCKNCGAPLDSDSKFCSSCGKEVQ